MGSALKGGSPSSQPTVAVVIPAFHAGRTRRLAYPALSEDQPCRIIMVDGGSPDDTAEVVRSLQRGGVLYDKNHGSRAHRNTCHLEALKTGADITLWASQPIRTVQANGP